MITTLRDLAAALDSDASCEQYEKHAIESGALHTRGIFKEPHIAQSSGFASTVPDGSTECDAGAIIRELVSSDMQFAYNHPELIVGKVSDNYWSGGCDVYDRATSFEITNLAKVTEFRITQVGFDNYLWIKVNGYPVYVGPDGEGGIELKRHFWHTVVSNGAGMHSGERHTNWVLNVDIDLKPYLRDGRNEIWTRVIVAGRGEGWMKIRVQH